MTPVEVAGYAAYLQAILLIATGWSVLDMDRPRLAYLGLALSEAMWVAGTATATSKLQAAGLLPGAVYFAIVTADEFERLWSTTARPAVAGIPVLLGGSVLASSLLAERAPWPSGTLGQWIAAAGALLVMNGLLQRILYLRRDRATGQAAA